MPDDMHFKFHIDILKIYMMEYSLELLIEKTGKINPL